MVPQALPNAELALGPGPWQLEGRLENPCVLPESGAATVQTILSAGNELQVCSLVEGNGPLPPHWVVHFRGKVTRPPKAFTPRVEK